MSRYHRLYLSSVLLIAALLRVPFLGSIPNGFYSDEASTGYDAYSILNTGRDQYGELLPLFARSFGDYVEASYRWIAVPSVAVFGLNEFATRLPAALVGILTVWVLYLLVRMHFGRRAALAAALFLAISPWHIQFSRCAFRAILLPLFLCMGLLFLLKGLRRPTYVLLSGAAFAACLHTYHSARVFVPLFVLGLVWIFRRDLWRAGRWALASSILFLCVLVPLSLFWVSPEGMARAGVALTDDPLSIPLNVLSYFSPLFLFFNGDPNIRHSALHVGQLHPFELITVAAGIWGLLVRRRREDRVVWLWLLLYPFPAALTEPGHALRAIAGAPLFAILSGYGFSALADAFKSTRGRRIFPIAGAAVVAIGLGLYVRLYFVDYPTYSARWWQYGMKEAILTAEEGRHRCVIVSDRAFFYPAYIFVLFYTRYPPADYQRLPPDMRQNLWIHTEKPLKQYHTLDVSDFVLRRGRCLLVLQPDEVAEVAGKGYDWREVHTIDGPDGKAMIKLVEIKK